MSNPNHRRFPLSFRAAPTQNMRMPIAREHRWLYPIDWHELSALVRFDRARGMCEHCRRPHGCEVLHLGNGIWWDEAAGRWRDDRGRGVRWLPAPAELARAQPGLPGIGAPTMLARTRVVLASAHLNHNPGDNRLRNLAALCQRCHMRHDAHEHQRRRWRNAFHERSIGDLFV